MPWQNGRGAAAATLSKLATLRGLRRSLDGGNGLNSLLASRAGWCVRARESRVELWAILARFMMACAGTLLYDPKWASMVQLGLSLWLTFLVTYYQPHVRVAPAGPGKSQGLGRLRCGVEGRGPSSCLAFSRLQGVVPSGRSRLKGVGAGR